MRRTFILRPRPSRSRRRTRRRHRAARRAAAAIILVPLLVLAGVLALAAIQDPLRGVPPDADGDGVAARHGRATASVRPIYRHSVIEGGVYSPEEVVAAIIDDPLVAAHYRDLVPERLRTETVAADRLAYVSYRKDGHIFWTRHRVRVGRGETILTDGDTEIRARCGNAISDRPRTPVAATDPDLIELDRLVEDSSPAAPPDDLAPVPAGLIERSMLLSLPLAPATSLGAGAPGGVGIPGAVQGWPHSMLPRRELLALGPPLDVGATNDSDDGSEGTGLVPPPGPPGMIDPLGPSDPPDRGLHETFDSPPPHANTPHGRGGNGPSSPRPVPVPEPGVFVLLGGGAAAMLIRRWRARW